MQEKAKKSRRFDPSHLTLRDVLIIVPLVLVLFVLTLAFGFLVSDETYIKWGGLGVDSVVLLAFFIFRSRESLRERRFWLLTASFFTFHLAGWIVFLSHVDQWKLAGFYIMVLEVPVFFYIRDWLDRTSS
jgi:multidrug transporter EmrE-like cation transporter